jgi:hypothetical protein
VIFRREPFHDVVSRQLEIFATDEADGLLAEVQEQKRIYDRAARDDAEEAYGEYEEAVETVKEALAEMRDRFGATLGDGAAEEYEAAFEEAARRRWRWLA